MNRFSPWGGVCALWFLMACSPSVRADMSYSPPPHWGAFLAPQINSIYVRTAEVPPIAFAGIQLKPSFDFSTFGSGTVSMKLLPFIDVPPNDPRRNLTYTFTAERSKFGMYIYLHDIPSRQSREVDFAGYFSGTMTEGASHVSATFTSPDTRTLRLGDYMYSLHVSYTPVGPPSSYYVDTLPAGCEGAFTVSVGGVRIQPIGTPEPSTLVLAALGFPLAGLVCWRTRRRSRGVAS